MKQKKLILFMPSIEEGGVEKNFFIISNYLSEKLDEVYLITASKKFKKKFNKKINLILPKFNFWDNCGRRIKYFICLIILFKKILLDNKIIVFCFQANVYCTFLCKLLNTKIIVRSNTSPSGWAKNYFKNVIFKKYLKLADDIVVNSYEFGSQLKERFNINVKIIYNPLNKKEITKLSKKKIEVNHFDKHSLKLINVARFSDQKDHITLLKSINLLKHKHKLRIKLLIIGKGKNLNLMKSYIKLNNLEESVKILNFTNNPFPYIKKADVFVLTSKFEGLPNVLLETLVLKKFVISSNCKTGPKEILLNGKGGLLFKVGNYKELSKKIIFFKKNRKICNKMLTNATKGLNRFDYKSNLIKYFYLVKNKL